MNNSEKTLIVMIVLMVIGVGFWVNSEGCLDATNVTGTTDNGRFEILEEFQAFDQDTNKSGRVIKDRVSGSCYYWIVQGNDTVMTQKECPSEPSELLGAKATELPKRPLNRDRSRIQDIIDNGSP